MNFILFMSAHAFLIDIVLLGPITKATTQNRTFTMNKCHDENALLIFEKYSVFFLLINLSALFHIKYAVKWLRKRFSLRSGVPLILNIAV